MCLAAPESEASTAAAVPDYLLPSRRAIDRHGAEAFESLLFFDPAAQERRFEVFASTVGLAGRRIADVGCGRADLLAWMRRRDIAYADYVGCDAMPEFVDIGRRRAAESQVPGARFLQADFVADPGVFGRLVEEERADTLLFSGSLNTLDDAAAKAALGQAWDAVGRAPGGVLAFNFLSQIEGQHNPVPTDLTRFGVLGMLGWALARTPLVLFCQYYLGGHDATVVMVAPARN